jgi:hypothetical protein
MSRRSLVTLTASVLIGALFLMGAGFQEKATPAHFAQGVCSSIKDWTTAIQNGSSSLDTQMNSAKTLPDVRAKLSAFLGDSAQLTTVALDGLNDAGVPSTPKGAEASKLLKTTFKKIRKALRGYQNDAEDVSIKNQATALRQLTALSTKVGTQFTALTKSLNKLKKLDPNHKLEKAFKANAACAAL